MLSWTNTHSCFFLSPEFYTQTLFWGGPLTASTLEVEVWVTLKSVESNRSHVLVYNFGVIFRFMWNYTLGKKCSVCSSDILWNIFCFCPPKSKRLANAHNWKTLRIFSYGCRQNHLATETKTINYHQFSFFYAIRFFNFNQGQRI